MATAVANPVNSTKATRSPSRLWIVLAFFVIYVVWGTTYLAIRYAVETIPPLVTAGVRHSIAGLILLAIAWSRGFRLRREHLVAGAVLGALFFLIGHGTLHWAEKYVSSGFAALLVATEPLWILLIGAAMRQQKINWLNGAGLLMGLTGVGILTSHELTSRTSLTWAIVAVLAGAASWALGVCVSPRLRLPQDLVGRAAVPLLCGAPMLLLAAAGTGEFASFHWSAISTKSLLGLAYLIIFGSVVAFTAYSWLLQHCSATLVATHTFVNPLVAVVIGWFWASEPLNMRVIVATTIILGSIILTQRGDRASEAQAEACHSD
jgi:drug/metabolite transporter (DMT)-like permease